MCVSELRHSPDRTNTRLLCLQGEMGCLIGEFEMASSAPSGSLPRPSLVHSLKFKHHSVMQGGQKPALFIQSKCITTQLACTFVTFCTSRAFTRRGGHLTQARFL